jgi:hypothetical protein
MQQLSVLHAMTAQLGNCTASLVKIRKVHRVREHYFHVQPQYFVQKVARFLLA